MSPRDVGLFVQSGQSDRLIRRVRQTSTSRAAFEHLYQARPDPWQSASNRYRYQSRKYERIVASLPAGRRFRRALDLGCGLGLLSAKIAPLADEVLGIDLAQNAVDLATAGCHSANVVFQQGDILNLSPTLDRRFDLVVIADALYYVADSIADALLASVAEQVADLLVPGGLCLLANHYFFRFDPDSRASRRIHNAFAQCARLRLASERWHPFYLVSILESAKA